MMPSVPLFVELCAGTAALSLRLHRRSARPPVSRMGAKTGYADALLRVLGLRPGQGAAHYLWCEPDPGVRLLLEAYRDPDLAREAAAIIRGWVDEEPRALWERLRAEGPPRGADPGDVGVPPREVARHIFITSRTIPGSVSKGLTGYDYIGSREEVPDGSAGRAVSRRALASAVAGIPGMGATVATDARGVDPREVARWAREVARWMTLWPWCYRQGDWTSGGPVLPGDRRQNTTATATATERAGMGLPATITPDARGIEPGPDLPPGTVAYMDPPYVGTSGYGHDLPRSEVVALARRWAEAGATVAISEAEPVDDLTADGWSAVNITGQRVGQARTFSRQQAEWVTMNRPPAWTPSEQCGLFG